jgi:hypothetical protein
MKAVTEFNNMLLARAMKSKATLAAAGKTPEEIQAELQETFKFEGDKLTHFMAALEVVGDKTDGLKRVMVMTAAEGEIIPSKAQLIGTHYYIPEMLVTQQAPPKKDDRKGGRGGKGKGKGKGGFGGGKGRG